MGSGSTLIVLLSINFMFAVVGTRDNDQNRHSPWRQGLGALSC